MPDKHTQPYTPEQEALLRNLVSRLPSYDPQQREIDDLRAEVERLQSLAASLSEDWHLTQKVATRLRAALKQQTDGDVREAAVDLTTAYLEDPTITLDELKPYFVALIEALDGVRREYQRKRRRAPRTGAAFT